MHGFYTRNMLVMFGVKKLGLNIGDCLSLVKGDPERMKAGVNRKRPTKQQGVNFHNYEILLCLNHYCQHTIDSIW